MNRAFLRRVLSREDGKPLAIGEAHRLAQNDVMLGNVMAGEIDRSETICSMPCSEILPSRSTCR